MKKKKILVIDDEKEMTDMIAMRLKYYGYACLTVNDPQDGAALAQKEKPAAILLDVLMPQMNGRQVCKQLKDNEVTREIPIVFLTAKDSADDVTAEMQAGGVGHITKPINDAELIDVIRSLIG